MGNRNMAAALAIIMIVAPACVPDGTGTAPPSKTGRTPPVYGDWNILEDTVISSDVFVNGNITVLPTVRLRIDNTATCTARAIGAEPSRFHVMVGATVAIANGSRLFVDIYESEPGTGLSLTGGSMLLAREALNATVGQPTVYDSSISVAAGEGEDAVLRINCSSWGDFQRSNLSVGAGAGDAGAPGRDGLAGGSALLHLVNAQLSGCNLSAIAGTGGDGGPPPDDSFSQGKGGTGGSVSARLDLSYISESRIDLRAGAGGDGPAGNAISSKGPRSGGPGGRGGEATLAWNGANLLFSDSVLFLTAGDGGSGGDGADAPGGLSDGGNGADGGAGGTASTRANDSGTFTFIDSRFTSAGGSGGPAGHSGLATGGGREGGAGNGGAGGAARFGLDLRDSFTGTSSALGMQGGTGGAGGTGPLAGEGGAGGRADQNITIETVSATARLLLERFTISSTGGRGGDGGTEFSTGSLTGIPGRGGAGGGSGISVEAEGNIRARETTIESEPGAGGASGMPSRAGATGPALVQLSTDEGNLTNCTVSRTIGHLDDQDRWTLINTRILAAEHFSISGKAIAEEYWVKRVTVKDVRGSAIMDGSVTVEVRRNGTLLESRRSNSRGESEFRLLDSLYTASGAQYRSYVLSAYDAFGRSSSPITVFWSPGIFVDLVLLNKPGPPLCWFTSPVPGNATTINANGYSGGDGMPRSFFLTGEARDSPQNDEPGIVGVQLRFGGAGPWLDLDFILQGDLAVWNQTWDVYRWAQGLLPAYPLGIIPLTIHARCFNGYFWSDDRSRGGSDTAVNVTVRLLSMPGPPPVIETTSPVRSTAYKTAEFESMGGKAVRFDARVAFTNGREVRRWAWCFDDTGGFREDFSSNVSPAASFVYPADREGEHLFAILKVFDNESARRVALLHAGVAYDEFGYDFDQNDGSTSVRVRILVRAPPDERQAQAPPYWALVVVAVGAGLGLWLLRVRKKK